MLATLPPELLCHVYSFLPPACVNQITLTCHGLYISALPSLYTTIVLSFKKHIRQLEISFQRKESFLHHVMQHHTKEILLKCKQGGQHRLTFEIRSLLRQLPHIRTLTLVDFHMLPIGFITPLLSLLPHLEQVSLRYCDLVSTSPSFSSTLLNDGTNSSSNSNNALTTPMRPSSTPTSLELFWTDFPKSAVEALLSALPCLTKVRLLANHNRYYMANNHALVSLLHYCRHVKDLDIGLQEVDERTVASSIIAYGKQIQQLSVRCHSPLILDTITKYAPFVRNLIIRFSLDTIWYASSSSPATPTVNASLQHQPVDEEPQQGKGDGGLLCLLSHCQRLERIQLLSMCPTTSPASQPCDTLPPIVSKALASVAQKRLLRTNPNTTITTMSSNNKYSKNTSSNGDSSSDSTSQHFSSASASKRTTLSMDNDNEDDGMTNVSALTTRLNMKTSSNLHDLREQRKRNEGNMIHGDGNNNHQGSIYGSNENDTVMTEGANQRRQNTPHQIQPPAININATTQMHSFDLQRQSAKEHTRIESSLTLDYEQLNEIRLLASMV